MTYTPAELFRMHLSFEQSENENKGQFTINKISTDLDLTQAFPSMHVRQKGNNPQQKQKQGSASKKQQPPVCPNENKMNYGEARVKTPSRKIYNKKKVRQVTFREGKRKDRNKPVKMTDESIAKRKILGFNGSGIICFLCRSTRHVAPQCNVYPHTKPTSTPCKCGLLHPEAVCKSRGNSPQQPGRVVRN
jgi:hypothetical protein